ncbi:MAG: hypothetical protein ACTSUD_02880 [Alphaproteobacteria bacterium]
MTRSRAQTHPAHEVDRAAFERILGRQTQTSHRPAIGRPVNDNRMPAHKRLALWAMPLAVLALVAAITWQFV